MRRATGRPLVLGFLGGYHGESLDDRVARRRGRRARAAACARSPRASCTSRTRTPTGARSAEPRPGGTGDATVDYLRDHLLFHAIDPADVAGV